MDTSGLFDCALFSELGDWLVTPTFYGDDLYASEKDAPLFPVADGVADITTVTAQACEELSTSACDLSEGQVLATETAFADISERTEAPALQDGYDDGDIFGLLSFSALDAAPVPDNSLSLCYFEEEGSNCCRDDASSLVDGSSSGDATSIADGGSSVSSYESECDSPGKISTKRAAKGRARPYDCLPKERKDKKKLQNKNAATRYRLKKKAEDVILLTEEQTLFQRNKELKERVSGLQQEIELLKELMRDICCSSTA